MKCFTQYLLNTALTIAVSCSIGCDTSEPDSTGGISVNNRGINIALARANPANIAQMPAVLLPGETIEHSDATHLSTRRVSQLGNPRVINSAGGIDLDNIALAYSRSNVNLVNATFQLAPKNAFPAALDISIRDDYQRRMDLLIAASTNTTDSLQSALGARITNATWNTVLRASRSIGLLTALGPEPDVNPNNLLPLVLVDRVVTYTVTSTNRQLTDSLEIRGTYTIRDRWGLPSLLAVESNTPSADQFDQITLRFDEQTQTLIDRVDTSNGTFTLKLKNL